jgi:hypothetical protein
VPASAKAMAKKPGSTTPATITNTRLIFKLHRDENRRLIRTKIPKKKPDQILEQFKKNKILVVLLCERY